MSTLIAIILSLSAQFFSSESTSKILEADSSVDKIEVNHWDWINEG